MEGKYTKLYRIWHWLMAFSVIGLLGTVFLRKTFLSWHTNSDIIIAKFSEQGIVVTEELAKVTAQAIRSGMWEWHYILAVGLGLSMIIRMYMMITKKAEMPIIYVFKSFKNNDNQGKIKYTVYTILCFFIMAMSISGAIIYFGQDLNMSKDSIYNVKEIHENMMNGVIIFVILHLTGVFKHELTTKEPIISKMIHGNDTIS